MNKQQAFTIIELLVAVAILGLVVTVAMFSLDRVRSNARNLKRIDDIKQIQTALQAYFMDEYEYPPTLSFGSEFTGSSSATIYMKLLPNNPTPRNDGACPNDDYSYKTYQGGRSYKIEFCLSGPTGNLSAGIKCATPQGILNRGCFTCGDQVNYDGQIYNTVQIGSQCWFKENLNIGEFIGYSGTNDGYDGQPGTNDDCYETYPYSQNWYCQGYQGIQKFCYNNNLNNCSVYGGLYEWAEVMDLPIKCSYTTYNCNGSMCISNNYKDCNYPDPSTTKHRGICPPNWHIPSKIEYSDLTNYINNNGYSGNEGYALKSTTWNGGDNFLFNAKPSGYKYLNGGVFTYLGSGTSFWSSSPNDTSEPHTSFSLNFNNDPITSNDKINRIFGTSIRCIKD